MKLAHALLSLVTGHVEPAILGGTPSDASQDAVVMLVLVDPQTSTRIGLCTAAMVAPNLVLTARHCVAQTNGDAVACAADGTPVVGGEIRANFDASSFYVFAGSDRADVGDDGTVDLATWRPSGRGRKILDDRSGTLCNHDLALVLLEQPIASVPVAALRLSGDVRTGEKLRTVGWGVTTTEIEPAKRQQRGGVTVRRVGPSDDQPTLTPSEFLFDESICLGDSGGPVFSEKSGAIVGVVSRGGNGSDPSIGPPSSTCTEADNLATKIAPFRQLLDDAFAEAGAAPVAEPPQDDEEGCNAGGRTGFGAELLALVAMLAGRRFRLSRAPSG